PRERPTLGVAVVTVALPPAQAAAAARHGASHAALVASVSPASPAEHAGLLVGDLLLALDGAPLESGEGLVRALAAHPGGPLRPALLRGGQPLELLVAAALPERRAA